MDTYLATARVRLRRFTPADADNLVALDSDPEVMRYLTGGQPTPRAVIVDEVLPGWLRYYEHSASFGFWAAIELVSGDFLGWFHFRPARQAPPGEVELGYRLRRAAWGRGYATEVAQALIDKGFAELGVDRVVASTMAANIASRRVMEKSGLHHVRTFRLSAAELAALHGISGAAPAPIEGDDVEYALTRAEWERQRRSRGG